MFEYQGTVVDGSRYGRFYCRAGWINTPAFMPVATRGSIKGLALDLLRHSRPAVILANGYHLSLRPGADVDCSSRWPTSVYGLARPNSDRFGWLPGFFR